MAPARLRDHDQLDGASNYVIWKARISFLLDEYGLKANIDNVVVVPMDLDQLKKYKKEMAKAKIFILNGVWDHVVFHIMDLGTSKEMWDSLSTLYQGYSEHQNMYLRE